MAERAADIKRRERAMREITAEYFVARERADAIRAGAEAKVARLQNDMEIRIAEIRDRAETAAADLDARAQAAVIQMLSLGETRQAITDITGMTLAQVRQAERSSHERAQDTTPTTSR